MKEGKFPSVDEALYLHAALIERFGGSEGLRDRGLLESALARPRSGYYRSLSEQAAALMHSLAKNHCFVDGNKRIALALTAAFLMLNGFRLMASADDSESLIINIASGKIDTVADIAQWLEGHMEKIRR